MRTISFAILFSLTLISTLTANELVDFGASTQPVSAEVAESLKLAPKQGAQIVAVYEITPAAKLRLQSGDVVTKLNGKPVFHATPLALLIASYFQKDEEIELAWYRNGSEKTANVILNRTISDADMAKKYIGTSKETPNSNDQVMEPFGLGNFLGKSPSRTQIRAGVQFKVNSPDGKISVGQSQIDGKRLTKITDNRGQVVLDELITSSEIATKVPEIYQRWVKMGFGIRTQNVQVNPSSSANSDKVRDMLDQLQKKMQELESQSEGLHQQNGK